MLLQQPDEELHEEDYSVILCMKEASFGLRLHQPTPCAVYEKPYTCPNQYTKVDACHDSDKVVVELCCSNLHEIPAEQTSKNHCKENAKYIEKDVAHKHSTRDPALMVGTSVFSEK